MSVKFMINVLLGLVLMTSQVQGAIIDLNKPNDIEIKKDNYTFGVTIDDLRYTVIMEENHIKKIELRGLEQTEFEIETTSKDLLEFVKKYDEMSWMEKMQYVITILHVPAEFVLDVVKEGVAV